MQEVLRMRTTDNMTMVIKILVVLGFFVLLLGALGTQYGCATTNGNAVSDKEKVEEVIGHVQRIEKAITWIAPIACGVVAVTAPEAVPACQMAVASARALQVVTDQAVAAYRADPTAQNAQAITDVLGQLQAAWSNLDSAYKGDATTLQSVKPQSRIHPWKWKRRTITVSPSSRFCLFLSSLQ